MFRRVYDVFHQPHLSLFGLWNHPLRRHSFSQMHGANADDDRQDSRQAPFAAAIAVAFDVSANAADADDDGGKLPEVDEALLLAPEWVLQRHHCTDGHAFGCKDAAWCYYEA